MSDPFSVRYGYKQKESPLGKGEIRRETRIKLLNIYLNYTLTENGNVSDDYDSLRDDWDELYKYSYIFLYHNKLNTWKNYRKYWNEYLENIFEKGKFDEIIDFIEYTLKFEGSYNQFKDFQIILASIFDKTLPLYYWEPTTKQVIERTSPVQDKSLLESLSYSQKTYPAAHQHLANAISEFKNNSYENSVRESINAIEAAIKVKLSDPKLTLGNGIVNLRKYSNAHPCLLDSLYKIYAYRGDESNIGHASKSTESSVDASTAVFLLSVCAAAVTFIGELNLSIPATPHSPPAA